MNETEGQLIKGIQTDVQEIWLLVEKGREMISRLQWLIEARLGNQIHVLTVADYELRLSFYGLPLVVRVEIEYGDRATRGKIIAVQLEYNPILTMEKERLAEYSFDYQGKVGDGTHEQLQLDNYALLFLDAVFQKLREKKVRLRPGHKPDLHEEKRAVGKAAV